MQKLLLIIFAAMCATIGSFAQNDSIIIPPPLQPGGKIAIVTPSSYIKDAIIDSAFNKLISLGYEPVMYPNAKGRNHGSYAADDSTRAAELMAAFADPDIQAILCSRGGYGSVRILPMLDAEVIRSNPKWLVGYSDISDLHAFMHKAGVASIHGPMAKHLAYEPDTIAATEYLFKALADSFPIKYELPPHELNNSGYAKARLVGGNLMCINGLAETPYDIMNIGDDEDIILFIEDISEQIYAIERVLMRMHYSGLISRLKGLIIGQFTEYRESEDFASMESMIHHWLKQWGYYDAEQPMPIVFDFPVGHVTDNYPMIVSGEVELLVMPEGTTLTFTGR